MSDETNGRYVVTADAWMWLSPQLLVRAGCLDLRPLSVAETSGMRADVIVEPEHPSPAWGSDPELEWRLIDAVSPWGSDRLARLSPYGGW